jgi:hypothetical protein
MVEVFVESMNEAGGYYTQPVYAMIKKHGYPKVMHGLLTSLDADVIQDFISRADLDEASLNESGPDESVKNIDEILVKMGAEAPSDIIADIMHWIDAHPGENLEDLIRQANGYYNDELEESYSPGDEMEDGVVSNCCGAPLMDYNDGHGRCSDCKEMAAGETDEEYYEADDKLPEPEFQLMKKSLLRSKWYLENEEMDPEMVATELRDVNAMLDAVNRSESEAPLDLDTSVEEEYMSLYNQCVAKLRGAGSNIYGVDHDVLPLDAKPNPDSPYNSGQVEENILPVSEVDNELQRIQDLVKFR